MQSFSKLVAAILAVLGVILVSGAGSVAHAKSGQRYEQGHYGHVHASRAYRCRGGRHYTYMRGWGCDYYRYTYDWPLGRR